MEKQIKAMSNKKLKAEWDSIEYHIRHFSYGSWELNYRKLLEEEANKRRLLL
jgi:hypothetical protein